MSLKARFVLATVLGNLIVLTILTATLITRQVQSKENTQRRKATFAAKSLQDWVQHHEQFLHPNQKESSSVPTSSGRDDLRNRLVTSDLFVNWLVIDPEGNQHISHRPMDQMSPKEEKIIKEVRDSQEVMVREQRVYFPIIRGDGNIYVVATDLKNFSPPGSQFHNIIIPTVTVMGLGTILLALVLYLIYETLLFRPLNKLVEAFRKSTRSDYSHRINTEDRTDEIGELFEGYNTMMSELESYQQHMESRLSEIKEEMEETRQSLITAQRLSSMGSLASGIAHEINNPISGMINAIRSLKDPELPDAKRADYLDLIEDGLVRIRTTVKKILDFSPREEELVIEKVSLQEIIEKTLQLEEHRLDSMDVEVVKEFPEEPLMVEGSRGELQQALFNIIKNSLDACATMQDRRTPKMELTLRRRSIQRVDLLISDNGEGIAEEHQNKIFEPFFTTKDQEKGTGLGLAITHRIVDNHGGAISVDSKHGKGTTVKITLPLVT